MIAYKLHYHQLTADHLTSCNALRSLFQLQQEGPDLLAGEAQFGAQGGGGQGAHADVGRRQSFFWKKGHWLMMHQSWNCTWHSLTMLNTFNWQVTPFWNTQTRLQKLYTASSECLRSTTSIRGTTRRALDSGNAKAQHNCIVFFNSVALGDL